MSSSATPFQDEALAAINLNSEAVLQIHNGNYNIAMPTLMKALATVKGAMAGYGLETSQERQKRRRAAMDNASSVTTTSSSAESKDDRSNHQEQVYFCDEEQQQCNDPSSLSSHSDQFMCKQPLEVHTTLAESDPQESFNALSYVIVYNLTLCHHLKGTDAIHEPLRVRQSYLGRVIELYKHVLDLLFVVEEPSVLDVNWHYMVLSNNMGHAYYVLENDESANRCFHDVWEAMMKNESETRHVSSSSNNNKGRSGGHRDKILHGLMSNIMLRLVGSDESMDHLAPAA